MTKAMARWAGLLGLAAVLAVGCAGRDDEASDAGGATSGAPEPADGMTTEGADDAATGGDGAAGDAAPTAALDLVAADRDVVRTGSMRVRVDEVDDALGVPSLCFPLLQLRCGPLGPRPRLAARPRET